jgi:hypothetical protein
MGKRLWLNLQRSIKAQEMKVEKVKKVAGIFRRS